MTEKDESLLDLEKSVQRTDSITERIARIRKEISKGESVYDQRELGRLQAMLDEYEQLLKAMSGG